MIQAATSAIQTTRRHEVVAKIRELAATDSLAELTDLIHRAYARLGQMGLQHTAVDQSVEVTAQRICGGACYVATLTDVIVGTIVVHPTAGHSVCTYSRVPASRRHTSLPSSPRIRVWVSAASCCNPPSSGRRSMVFANWHWTQPTAPPT